MISSRFATPWTVSWSSETAYTVAYCPYARGMALCQSESPRQGKPLFASPHCNRQRKAMALQLCDICGKALKGHTRVSLSQESAREVDGLGFVTLAVEPMVHAPCGAIAIRHCPILRRQLADGTIRIRQVSRFQLVAQRLNSAATLEFAGVDAPGTIGHLKLAIAHWVDRDDHWLKRSAT